jgi:hypothetical protein
MFSHLQRGFAQSGGTCLATLEVATDAQFEQGKPAIPQNSDPRGAEHQRPLDTPDIEGHGSHSAWSNAAHPSAPSPEPEATIPPCPVTVNDGRQGSGTAGYILTMPRGPGL